MRRISQRYELPASTAKKLGVETADILAALDRTEEAKRRYAAARAATWFKPILSALESMSGTGQRCMYCSGSESAQVEHYRPKSTRPEIALDWENLLWICGICNQAKGDRFEEANRPINPVIDNVWDFFFIDQFGNLTAKWDATLDDFNPRALRTIELHKLDRQALQECRQDRLIDLREKVADAVDLLSSGHLTRDDLEFRVLSWFEQPFQPDVADYFFHGPGAEDLAEPFKAFLELLAN